jgi:hypothetical protein
MRVQIKRAKQLMARKRNTSIIPAGIYCYDDQYCYYLRNRKIKDEPAIGINWCMYLKEHIGDMVKACGINLEFKKDEY